MSEALAIVEMKIQVCTLVTLGRNSNPAISYSFHPNLGFSESNDCLSVFAKVRLLLHE